MHALNVVHAHSNPRGTILIFFPQERMARTPITGQLPLVSAAASGRLVP